MMPCPPTRTRREEAVRGLPHRGVKQLGAQVHRTRVFATGTTRVTLASMERVAHKARGYEEARRWDIVQASEMTPDESRRVAKALRDRFYGTARPDVRDVVAGARRLRARRA